MDETGLALGVCSNSMTVGTSATKKAVKRTPETREWVSIIETVAANGRKIRPLVIFKGSKKGSVQTSWFSDEIPSYEFTSSACGYTTNEISLRWLKEIFLPETATLNGETRLLVLDNQGSHITEDFMLLAYRNNVQIVYLPPHTSHIT